MGPLTYLSYNPLHKSALTWHHGKLENSKDGIFLVKIGLL